MVAVVNLARRQRLTRLAQFIATAEHGNTRAGKHWHFGKPQCRCQRCLRRQQTGRGGNRQLATAQILAAAADSGAGRGERNSVVQGKGGAGPVSFGGWTS